MTSHLRFALLLLASTMFASLQPAFGQYNDPPESIAIQSPATGDDLHGADTCTIKAIYNLASNERINVTATETGDGAEYEAEIPAAAGTGQRKDIVLNIPAPSPGQTISFSTSSSRSWIPRVRRSRTSTVMRSRIS